MMDWARVEMPSIFVIVVVLGAGLLFWAARWALPLQFSAAVDVFGLYARLSVKMFILRFDARLRWTQDNRAEFVFEGKLLRFVTWHSRADNLFGAGQRSADADEGQKGKDARQPTGTNRGLLSKLSLMGYDLRQWMPLPSILWQGLRRALQHGTLEQLQMKGVIGLGEAASTARAYGGFWTLYGLSGGMLQKYLSIRCAPQVHIVPAFNQRRLRFATEGKLVLRLGDALAAVMFVLGQSLGQLLSSKKTMNKTKTSKADMKAGDVAS